MNKWIWSEDGKNFINLAHVVRLGVEQIFTTKEWMLVAIYENEEIPVRHAKTVEEIEAFIRKNLCAQLDVILC